jgi:hypothetical protein
MGWGMKGKCGGGVQNKDAFVYILEMGIARFDHLPSASRIYPELKSLSLGWLSCSTSMPFSGRVRGLVRVPHHELLTKCSGFTHPPHLPPQRHPLAHPPKPSPSL